MQLVLTKRHRQSKILTLIRVHPVSTQAGLAHQLSAEGIRVTQATLSRDLHELNIVKTVDGYQPPDRFTPQTGSKRLEHETIAQFVTEVAKAGNLVVVKTNPGNAAPVARSLDNIGWNEIIGTVAGDDTVIVVTKGSPAARTVQKRLIEIHR